MKKMTVAAATTAIAALGSLVLAPAAQADPYPRSIDTNCVAVASDTKVAPGDSVRVKFKWTAEGNVSPKGAVKWVVKRKGGSTFDTGSFFMGRGSNTKTVSFAFPKGTYVVSFRTQTGDDSVLRNCSAATDTIKVRRGF